MSDEQQKESLRLLEVTPNRRFPLMLPILMAKLSLSGRLRRELCVAAVVSALTKPYSFVGA